MLAVKLGSLQPKLPVKQHLRGWGAVERGREVYEGGREGTERERSQNRNGSKKKQSQPNQTKPFDIPVPSVLGKNSVLGLAGH